MPPYTNFALNFRAFRYKNAPNLATLHDRSLELGLASSFQMVCQAAEGKCKVL